MVDGEGYSSAGDDPGGSLLIVVDGDPSARFMADVAAILEEPALLLESTRAACFSQSAFAG